MKLISKVFLAALVVLCLGCTCEKEEKDDLDIAKDIPASQEGHIREIAARAQQGDCNAQSYLGVLYYTGTIGRNHNAAMSWFKKASENGSGEADFFLAEMYREGIHVKENPEVAFKYLLSSANKGFAGARIMLAEMYAEGEKISPVSKEDLISWLDEYIKYGNEKAKAVKQRVEKFDPKAKKTEAKSDKEEPAVKEVVKQEVKQEQQKPAEQISGGDAAVVKDASEAAPSAAEQKQ